MATFKEPSQATLDARARRVARAGQNVVRIQWFIDQVANKVKLSIKQRVTLATQLVRDRVVRNISRPVTKGTGPRGGRVVTDRSKAGEFPKADTTQLLKTLFSEVVETANGDVTGYIGTPLDYGLILEVRMGRSFLVRTLNESRAEVDAILMGPIK